MSAEKTAHTVSCSSMCEALIGTQTNSSTKRFIYISCVFIRLKLYEVHSSSSFSHFSYFAIMMMVMMMTFACLHLFFFVLCVESFLRQKIMLLLVANSLSFSSCSLLSSASYFCQFIKYRHNFIHDGNEILVVVAAADALVFLILILFISIELFVATYK